MFHWCLSWVRGAAVATVTETGCELRMEELAVQIPTVHELTYYTSLKSAMVFWVYTTIDLMRGNNLARTVNQINKGRDLKYTSRHCIPLTAGINSENWSFVTCDCQRENIGILLSSDLPLETYLLHRSETLAQTSGLLLPPNWFLLSTPCFHAFIDLPAGAVTSFQSHGRTDWEDESPDGRLCRTYLIGPSSEAPFAHDEVTGSSRLPQSAGRRRRLMDRLLPQGSVSPPLPTTNKCNRGQSRGNQQRGGMRAPSGGITQTEMSMHTHVWDICVTRNTLDPECISHLKC